MKPSPARLLRAADLLPEDFADVRQWLELQAEDEPAADGVTLRRQVLQRLRQLHFHFIKDYPAACAIAELWATLPETELCIPNTPSGELDRLRRAGLKPLGWRQILEVLDGYA